MKCKKIIALLLAVVIAFGSAGAAFAEDTEYVYYGELTEGWTNVWGSDYYDEVYDLYVYYTFDVPAEGYYRVSFGTPHTSMNAWLSTQICDNEDITDVSTTNDWYQTEKIYYLDVEEYNFFVDIYASNVEVSIYCEYLGEEITGITFDYDQLFDCDFDYGKHSGGEKHYFSSTADATIEFSSGKIFKYTDGIISGKLDSEYKDGVNDIQIELFEEVVSSTATVYPVSHYISDIEISNLEYYMENSTEYYNYCDGLEPDGETVTVTFADGSTQQFEYYEYGSNCVTLPNGQNYRIYVYCYADFPLDRDKCCLQIRIGNIDYTTIKHVTVKEYKFSGKKAPFSENLRKLWTDMGEIVDEAEGLFIFSLENLDIMNLIETLPPSFENFVMSLIYIYSLQGNIWEFVWYYLL